MSLHDKDSLALIDVSILHKDQEKSRKNKRHHKRKSGTFIETIGVT